MASLTRGYRLNNPFNLKLTDIKWQGKVTSSDMVFEQFVSPLMGLRAGFKNLLEQEKEGNNTVFKIISKYAPTLDGNNTNAYIKAVCSHLNVNPDDKLDLDNYETLYALGSAIILHEQGSIIYTDSVINQAIMLAGVHNPVVPNITNTPEAKTAMATGAITTVSFITDTVNNLNPAIPLLQQVISIAPWIATAMGVGLIGYICYIMYLKKKQIIV